MEAFAIPNQSAETIADVVSNEYFSRFGIPLNIHTDQGKNFDGSLMNAVCEKLKINKTRTTPYHPSSNGQVERYNRTLLQMIRCYVDKEHSEWDKYLPLLTSAIRAITSRQTGFTANKLMLGRELNMPFDIILGMDELRAEELAPENYIDRLQKKVEKLYRFARGNINEFQTRQTRDYDVKLFEHQYSLGDLVYEIDSSTKLGQSRKLKKMWKGPYLVVNVISPALYQIKGTKEPRIVHNDRLKLCFDRDVPVWVRQQRKLLFEDKGDTEQGNNASETKPN